MLLLFARSFVLFLCFIFFFFVFSSFVAFRVGFCSVATVRCRCVAFYAYIVCVSAAATTILRYERKRILENALQMARWHLCSRSHAHRTIERQSESHLLSSQHANALKWIMRLLFRCFVYFCVKLSLSMPSMTTCVENAFEFSVLSLCVRFFFHAIEKEEINLNLLLFSLIVSNDRHPVRVFV